MQVELTVNGAAADRRGRAAAAARALPARGVRPAGRQRRLRHHLVRRLHGAARRRVGEVLHGAGRAGRRRSRSPPRRAWPSGGRGDCTRCRPAFRQEHGLQCGFCTPGMVMAAVGLLAREPAPDRGRGPRGAGGQPLPLHRLPQHRPRGAGRRGRQRGGERMIPAPFDYVAAESAEARPGAARPSTATTRSCWPAATRCCR